jgi:hypothetical protein
MSESPTRLESMPAARNRRAAPSERAPSNRSRQHVTTSAMAEIEQILQGYEEQATNKCADTSATSVWIELNVVLDHSTFQKSLLAHDLSSKTRSGRGSRSRPSGQPHVLHSALQCRIPAYTSRVWRS